MSARHDFNTIIILAVFLAIFCANSFQAVHAKQIICDYCKEPIEGRYVEVDGKFYHPHHFKCAECKVPIVNEKYYEVSGKYYCEKCYLKLFAPKCAYCGKPIVDEYVTYDGKPYHKSCYRDHIALRCSLCGGIIEDEYLTDFWGNVYHKYHEGNIPKCDYCGRFISDRLTDGGYQYDDGRNICGLCKRTAVENLSEAKHLLDGARMQLARKGIKIESDDIDLHLVDRKQLKDLAHNKSNDQMGFVKYDARAVNDVIVSRNFDVYILQRIPKIDFIATAAHELMHIWQYVNAPFGNDLAFCEGSCNYASYIVLQQYPDKKSEYVIDIMNKDQDEIYGEGFRQVKKLVKDRGISYWLNWLQKDRNFPKGY